MSPRMIHEMMKARSTGAPVGTWSFTKPQPVEVTPREKQEEPRRSPASRAKRST
jgi:hypothetical protein